MPPPTANRGSKVRCHPSWTQIGPNTYTQPYGFQEVLYNAISVEPGLPGLFLLGSSVTFTYTPSNPNAKSSSASLIPLLRNAWLQMRQRHPTLAVENLPNGKVYTCPSSPAELEVWLNATFVVAPGKTWEQTYGKMVKTSQMTMYYCPEAGQLFIQSEHHTLDGRGIMNFWHQFFEALVSPAELEHLFKTDGSEISRLPPRSDDLLDMAEKEVGRGEQRALELVAPLSAITAPICIPVAEPLPPPSPHNTARELRVSARTTESIVTACKAQRLSVTAAWHTAVVLATQSIQAKRNTITATAQAPAAAQGSHFASFGNFDLRRYFPLDPDNPEAYTLSNHHIVLPYVVAPNGSSFAQVARDLGSFYQQDIIKSDPDVWSALGPMIRMFVPEFTREQLVETTPALSSLGVVDSFIASLYTGQDGSRWHVKDPWFGNTVTGPWLEHFMWSWQGRLLLNSCCNPAYYMPAEADEFNETVLQKLVEGLGIQAESKL